MRISILKLFDTILVSGLVLYCSEATRNLNFLTSFVYLEANKKRILLNKFWSLNSQIFQLQIKDDFVKPFAN